MTALSKGDLYLMPESVKNLSGMPRLHRYNRPVALSGPRSFSGKMGRIEHLAEMESSPPAGGSIASTGARLSASHLRSGSAGRCDLMAAITRSDDGSAGRREKSSLVLVVVL